MYNFSYVKAQSLKHAGELLAANPEAKLLAGGMTLIPTLKARLARPSHLIDVGGLPELAGIDNKDGKLIIGAGVLALLGSLLPYYTVSVEFLGASAGGSGNAWSGGFLGWFGALLALAGAGVLVAKILGVSLPVPARTTVLGLFAGAAVLTLLALFVFPGGGCDDLGIDGVCDGVDEGRGFGYWLALLATIAGTALAAVRRSAD